MKGKANSIYISYAASSQCWYVYTKNHNSLRLLFKQPKLSSDSSGSRTLALISFKLYQLGLN